MADHLVLALEQVAVVDAIVGRFDARPYRWNPYSLEVVKVSCIRGVHAYSSTVEAAAAPFGGPTTTIVVGCVPYAMRAACLRWVVWRVTGVTPLAVHDGRRNLQSRAPSGVFFITVRANDAPTVLAASGRALCCTEFLWLPEGGDAAKYFSEVAQRLKEKGWARTNPLRFERAN